MALDVFNDLIERNFVIDNVVRRITKKGIDNILSIEVKDFIRSNPKAKLESANIRFDKSTNRYLFTYRIAHKERSKTYYKVMILITRYQMMSYFKEVKDK